MRGRYKKIRIIEPDDQSTKYLDPKKAPLELSGTIAKSIWKTVLSDLEAENRKIPQSNRQIVIGFCAAAQMLVDCDDALRNDGLLVDAGRDGKRRHPAFAGKIQALGLIRQYSSDLGLTPASASRLPLPEIEKEHNPFDDI